MMLYNPIRTRANHRDYRLPVHGARTNFIGGLNAECKIRASWGRSRTSLLVGSSLLVLASGLAYWLGRNDARGGQNTLPVEPTAPQPNQLDIRPDLSQANETLEISQESLDNQRQPLLPRDTNPQVSKVTTAKPSHPVFLSSALTRRPMETVLPDTSADLAKYLGLDGPLPGQFFPALDFLFGNGNGALEAAEVPGVLGHSIGRELVSRLLGQNPSAEMLLGLASHQNAKPVFYTYTPEDFDRAGRLLYVEWWKLSGQQQILAQRDFSLPEDLIDRCLASRDASNSMDARNHDKRPEWQSVLSKLDADRFQYLPPKTPDTLTKFSFEEHALVMRLMASGMGRDWNDYMGARVASMLWPAIEGLNLNPDEVLEASAAYSRDFWQMADRMPAGLNKTERFIRLTWYWETLPDISMLRLDQAAGSWTEAVHEYMARFGQGILDYQQPRYTWKVTHRDFIFSAQIDGKEINITDVHCDESRKVRFDLSYLTGDRIFETWPDHYQIRTRHIESVGPTYQILETGEKVDILGQPIAPGMVNLRREKVSFEVVEHEGLKAGRIVREDF